MEQSVPFEPSAQGVLVPPFTHLYQLAEQKENSLFPLISRGSFCLGLNWMSLTYQRMYRKTVEEKRFGDILIAVPQDLQLGFTCLLGLRALHRWDPVRNRESGMTAPHYYFFDPGVAGLRVHAAPQLIRCRPVGPDLTTITLHIRPQE